MIASKLTYLSDICDLLTTQWPDNRTVNIICHGHSVPAGYFTTPHVDTLNAYPHLLLKNLKQRYPFAVLNTIVTAIGGEHSQQGAARFIGDVLCHRPDVVTLDYGLNDRKITIRDAEMSWRFMIEAALENNVKMILLTPSWEQACFMQNADWDALFPHVEQIRALAAEYSIGLSDTFESYQRYIDMGGELQDLISIVNHPSLLGHEIIARDLARWFYRVFEFE